MSPIHAIKSMSEIGQLVMVVGSVAAAAYGIGINAGQKPDLEPQVRANTKAIDSLRVRTDSIGRDIADIKEELQVVGCWTRQQIRKSNEDPFSCL